MSLKQTIQDIAAIKARDRLTPQQSRYVDKKVREFLKLQLPKAAKPLPDFLNPAEVYRILEVAQRESATDGLLVEFQIFTGLRIGETRNLLIQHIDFYNNQLKVVAGKGGKDRHVPVSNNLLHKLRMHINARKAGFVFCKPNETAYTVRALQKRIEGILRQCAFSKKLSTHSLRHTFACMCLARGMRLEDIQLMMGHSSIKTTQIYAKLELGPVKEKYLQLVGSY